MATHRFYQLDVFTDKPLAGNPLAVFPQADGLSGDIMQALIPGFVFLGLGAIAGFYRLAADLISVLILVGMMGLLLRRFFMRSPELSIREDIHVLPGARNGIRRDSAIVGGFILIHI